MIPLFKNAVKCISFHCYAYLCNAFSQGMQNKWNQSFPFTSKEKKDIKEEKFMKKRVLLITICALMLFTAACAPASAPISQKGGEEHSLYSDYETAAPSASAAASKAPSDWDLYQASGDLDLEAPAASSAASSRSAGGTPQNADSVSASDYTNESYADEKENGFKTALKSPLSTFSIDVDTASYSNIRRYLQEGRLPPPNAVRIEEMVNYFCYDYPKPEGSVPFALLTSVMRCPWNNKNLLAVIGLNGKDTQETPPSNLVFLIDVSGSMADADKLPLLKTAFSLLVNELTENDTVSIVTYASTARVALEPADGSQKAEILRTIDQLTADGNTAGGKGIKMAYDLAEKHFIHGGNNRVLLATDGDFNVGVSSINELIKLISEKKEKGVFLSVLGFGQGNLKDDKMETLADKGNGNYSYIDSISEAQKVLVSERCGTLNTIAKDVKLQVEFNPAMVESYRLIGYENRMLKAKDFDDDQKDAGEVGAGHAVTALYEITPSKDSGVDDIALKYREPVTAVSGEWMTIHLRYKEPAGDISRELQKAIGKDAFTLTPAKDTLFAASVAEFGLLLKGSEYMGGASIKNVLSLAKEGYSFDPDGYRQEYMVLVKKAYAITR